MGAHRVSAVVFDVGNVLVHWDIRRLYARLIHDPVALEHFCSSILTPDWHFHHDAGASLRDTIPALVAKHPEYRELIEAYEPRWMDTVGPDVAGMAALVDDLDAAGVPLFAITNFSIELWPRFVAVTPMISRFRDVIVSGAHKIVKPDPAIYHLARDRFGLLPDQAIFIDDRLENITAARANGFAGHHFSDAGTLRRALVALGLLAG